MDHQAYFAAASELQTNIQSYVDGAISREEFVTRYPQLLGEYETAKQGSAGDELVKILPSAGDEDRMMKQNMLFVYKREIETLEAALQQAPKTVEPATDEDLLKHCQEALAVLPCEQHEHVIQKWVQENLVDDVRFVFEDEQGVSQFGEQAELYHADIAQESFLLSAMLGKLPQPQFDYSNLLALLGKATPSQTAAWVCCTEPEDQLATVEPIASVDGSAFTDVEVLSWIEKTTGESVKWGDCHLLLLPDNFSWMLKISHDFNRLSISLHGDASLVADIRGELGLA